MEKTLLKSENQSLYRLQKLSEEISDKIHDGNYDGILTLDQERMEIIKSFKKKPDIKTIEILKEIVEQGKLEIKYIENETSKLNKLHNKAIKTFRAYSFWFTVSLS